MSLLCLSVFAAVPPPGEQRERDKYYDKWLNQDVAYIITDDERAVFYKLKVEVNDSINGEFT